MNIKFSFRIADKNSIIDKLKKIKNLFIAFRNLLKRNVRIISLGVFMILCIALIIYAMPKEKSIHYEFRQNTPWAHEQLRAEFDFDVPKNASEIAAEEDSIRKRFAPVFKSLGDQNAEHEKRVAAAFGSNTNMQGVIQLFDSLFVLSKRGIIQDEEIAYVKNFKHNLVHTYSDGQKSTALEAKDFITVSDARKELLKITQDTQLVAQHTVPSYSCNIVATQKEFENMTASLKTISPILTKIKEGEKIISNGDIVDAKSERIIKEYLSHKNTKEKARSKSNWQSILIGQAIFIVICMAILLAYLNIYKKDVVRSNNKFIFTIIAVSIFPILVGLTLTYGNFNVFVMPFAITPIILCLFIDHNTSFIASMVSIAMCSIMLSSPFEFLLLQIMAACSAILSLRDLSSRSQMFKCVAITFLTYSAIYLCYELIISAGFSNFNSRMYIYFAISTVLTLFIYPLMFLIERTFGFISNVTLIELSNLNNKLLQRMSQEVPGTFQHSMQVGNLASAAALAIGANPLVVRTGALYHDIGKLENPINFTENQNGGTSPHENMSPIESAQAIIKHVTEGVALAEHEGLPKTIKEFITTHHGLSKTGYFYITYKNEHPDEKIDESLFTYPGPRPYTKEQAVLMMADCVEAASHSIKEYTEENINTLVDNIIDAKFKDGELMMSPMTFQDISTVKEVFKKRLMAIYHTRISYPTEKKQ